VRALGRAVVGLVAFCVAAFGVFLAVLFYVYYYPFASGPSHFLDSYLGSTCADRTESVCNRWEAPSGVLGW
jgi:hypothetical protein